MGSGRKPVGNILVFFSFSSPCKSPPHGHVGQPSLSCSAPSLGRDMNLSLSLAMSIAGLPRSNPALKISSTSVCPPRDHPSADSLPQKPLYHGVSDRPLGWKMRCKTTGTQNIKRFHGRSGASSSWDGLRRVCLASPRDRCDAGTDHGALLQDPELWLPNANCFVHLHGPTSSQRGPAFRIPLEAVHATQSSPLLERFVPQEVVDADDAGTAASCKTYNIYIPSPNTLDRAQAYLDHLATRNFIAWMLGRPLVGNHLGEALVGLLESMKKYRSPGLDHIATLMDYMSHMGYDDLQNHPDHVLAVLFLAERYQFRDLWIDAHAHGVGMHDRLYPSPGYKVS